MALTASPYSSLSLERDISLIKDYKRRSTQLIFRRCSRSPFKSHERKTYSEVYTPGVTTAYSIHGGAAPHCRYHHLLPGNSLGMKAGKENKRNDAIFHLLAYAKPAAFIWQKPWVPPT